jgi:uncharacterized membrane protein YphA (DoxX/SURF4 family)
MLNTFPTLLAYSMFAPMILRISLGIILIGVGITSIFEKRELFKAYFVSQKFPYPNIVVWIFGIAEIISGSFLVIGLSTQIVAIIAVFLLLNIYSFESRDDRLLPYSPPMYLILCVISLSLLFSGAGFFAIDLPL